MKSIYFKSTHLLSLSQKKGFFFEFSPNINLIYGENDTGKSSLIKSLYYTLGADVHLDKEWKNDNFISKVVIHVKSRDYAFLRHGKRISIFDLSNDSKQLVSSAHRAEIAKVVGDIFDFNLKLIVKNAAEQSQAYPASLYLPFYIDQDDGWGKVLDSFDHLAMYKDWQKNILQFHIGIKPKEYYKLQGEISLLDTQLLRICATLETLELTKKRFEESFGRVLFDVDIGYYEMLLQRFLDKSQKLHQEETDYRLRLIEALSYRDEVAAEIEECKLQLEENDVSSLSKAVDLDDKYAVLKNRDILLDLIPKLYEQKFDYDQRIDDIKEELKEAQKTSSELNTMLRKVESELTLQDVIKSQASKQIECTFDEQINELLKEISELNHERDNLVDTLSKYSNRKRTTEINNEFKGYLSFAQAELSIKNPVIKDATQYTAITKSETGSRAPRSILAYHYALLKTIESRSSIPMLPVVIDSPKQQDPDEHITKKIFDLCVDGLSGSNQLIIGSVSFDRNIEAFHTLKMTSKYSLLQEDLYDEVYDEIRTLYRAIHMIESAPSH